MLKCAGRFYFYTMSNKIPFQKPYTSAHDLVFLLQSRGLTITNTAKAESYLEYIGYYRLSAYMYPLLLLAEVLPFGVITNIFSNIKVARIKKSIARRFGLQVVPFESWLTIVTLTRNSCCHHARVWNKQNTIRPMIPNRMAGNWITLPTDALRIYFNLCIIKYFLNIISPNNDMKTKIDALLDDFPDIDTAAMGMPHGWEGEPLWQ